MDLVCFANDWDGDPLSKQHIMRRLARRGARVLWVNSLGNRAPRLGDRGDWARAARKLGRFAAAAARGPREVDANVWVTDPIAVPAYGNRAAAAANAALVSLHVRAAARRLGLRRPVHYTFVPASAWVARRLGESLLVYHAADEYGAFAGADAAAVAALEARLLAAADLYVACSAPLYEAKAPRARRAALVRHGVEHEHFARALDPATAVADELAGRGRPVVGFVGLLAEWVDLELLGRVADALAARGGTLVVVGGARGADPGPLAARANVILAGRRPYAELPRWLRGFDAALLPFRVDALTVHANPLKLREYLAAGLPVVATDLPEARALADAGVRVARSGAEFVAETLRAACAADRGPRPERSRAVAHESWDAKVDELERHIEAARRSSR